MIKMPVKIALPKGRLLSDTSSLLDEAGWQMSGYNEKARLYRLNSPKFPNLTAKLFHERDVPIQVATGNYDLGICGLDWVEELLTKYPSSALIKVRSLGYGEGTLYVASASSRRLTKRLLQSKRENIRIASEYPNLAESFALNLRLRRFSVFPLWGGAQVYPPESADLAIISELNHGLAPISEILRYNAFLIANEDSWKTKDLSEILASLEGKISRKKATSVGARSIETVSKYPAAAADAVWLALPDGHQQQYASRLLAKAGIWIDDYPSETGNRRPTTNLDGVMIKVIRPQDMPLQVANGNFDIAITGRDWLREHLYQFPSSPATELLDLKMGRVKIVAVVSKDLPIESVRGLSRINAGQPPIRIASEYTNIADKYARDNHLGRYRIIPTWGATEAFLPEDADLLIENTETGQTIARHNLKIIDTLFESTACLIGNSAKMADSNKSKRIRAIIEKFEKAVEET